MTNHLYYQISPTLLLAPAPLIQQLFPQLKQRGLSYILGDSNSNENHILPINSIQYSSSNRQLYTAGRDGNVKVWQPHSTQPYSNQHSRNNSQDDLFSDCLDLDEKLLRLETSISSNPLSYNYNGNTSSNFNIVENYNLHFDWINDMQLINNDQNLITCSSDLSIKIIDLPTQHVNELTNNNKSHNKELIFINYPISIQIILKLSFCHQTNHCQWWTRWQNHCLGFKRIETNSIDRE